MMKQETFATGLGNNILQQLVKYTTNFPRQTVIGLILVVALFAFELFNFDTTRFALANLLGSVSFAGIGWATILALAFCSIDFAGLVRLFTPENDGSQPREVWYLMGAWLLGATMNALMTWWAISLTLLNHDFGNEVLSREQLLTIVPIFVAVLVWLTRILFIGALTVAGNHLVEFAFMSGDEKKERDARPLPAGQPKREAISYRGAPNYHGVPAETIRSQAAEPHISDEVPSFLNRQTPQQTGQQPDEEFPPISAGIRRVNEEEIPDREKPRAKEQKPNGRVRQRPPMPGNRPSSFNDRPRRRN